MVIIGVLHGKTKKFLHEHLNSLDVSSLSIEDQWVLLENKFRTALNAKLESAPFLFDQLSGNNGLNPLLKEIKGDATTLIAIARTQRQMKIEMDNLKLQIQSLTANNLNTSKKTSNDFSFFTPDNSVPGSETENNTPKNK